VGSVGGKRIYASPSFLPHLPHLPHFLESPIPHAPCLLLKNETGIAT
jgi:hypothetical protein